MKIIIQIFKNFGTHAKEEQKGEVIVPAMKSMTAVKEEAMLLVGFILSMLTLTFGYNKSDAESCQAAFIFIVVSCNGVSRKVYEQEAFIPANGQKHQLWLLDVRNRIRQPLETFLVDAALHDNGGDQS